MRVHPRTTPIEIQRSLRLSDRTTIYYNNIPLAAVGIRATLEELGMRPMETLRFVERG